MSSCWEQMSAPSRHAGQQNHKAQGTDLLFSLPPFATDLWQCSGNAFVRSQFTLTSKNHPLPLDKVKSTKRKSLVWLRQMWRQQNISSIVHPGSVLYNSLGNTKFWIDLNVSWVLSEISRNPLRKYKIPFKAPFPHVVKAVSALTMQSMRPSSQVFVKAL